MPSALETIVTLRLCFVAFDMATLTGDASCSDLLSACTGPPLLASLFRSLNMIACFRDSWLSR
jgi:hypothetical protein